MIAEQMTGMLAGIHIQLTGIALLLLLILMILVKRK